MRSGQLAGQGTALERFRFKSSSERTIIYGLLLVSQRQRIHHLVADWHRRVFALQGGASALHEGNMIVDLLAFHAELAGEVCPPACNNWHVTDMEPPRRCS